MEGLIFFLFPFLVLYLMGKFGMAKFNQETIDLNNNQRRRTTFGKRHPRINEFSLTDEERVNKVLEELKENGGGPPVRRSWEAW